MPENLATHGRRKSSSLGSSSTIGPGNGLVYVGSDHGGFFATSVNRPGFLNGRLPDAPWPKFHHDIQNRGELPLMSGIGGEPQTALGVRKQSATIVRAVLELPAAASHKPQTASWLLDATGRRVAELHPGPNDVSRLAPGIYFVTDLGSGGRGRGEVRKVVIAK